MSSDLSELARQMCQGDTDALRGLLEACGPALFRAACAWTADRGAAEDLVQTVFLKAWQRRSTLADPAKVVPWLYAILNNSYRDYLRQRMRREVVSDQVELELDRRFASSSPTPENHVLERERWRDLNSAIRALPDLDAQILTLRYGNELKVDDIAAALGLRPNTVKSRIRRALRTLERQFPELNK